jgi:hypothetical protein
VRYNPARQRFSPRTKNSSDAGNYRSQISIKAKFNSELRPITCWIKLKITMFWICKKNKKNKKKKLNAVFSKSISVYAASDARGQYFTKSKKEK